MTDDPCDPHVWGDVELCETPLGNIMSPTCRHCGAVKLELERRAHERAEFDRRLAAGGVRTNMPARNVRVHPFQTEFFADA